jgi:dolichol kinase
MIAFSAEPLTLSALKIAGSVALLAFVLALVAATSRRAHLPAEVSRKLIHVSLGLYCITLPWIFDATWEVAATCGLAAGLFALARGALRTHLGAGLHGVKRVSYGEMLFALSVVLLFELRGGHWIVNASADPSRPPELVLYVLPLLILTLCDAASAVVGSTYGRTRFTVEEGDKSWEGVVVFVVLAWLLSLITLLLLSDLPRADAIVLALVAALFGALLEAASWRGLDNLFIPLGLYFILANLMMRGVETLLLVTAIFALALALVPALAKRLDVRRHWLATAATLIFCIIIFSGPISALAPAAALIAYGLSARRVRNKRPPHDPLNLLLTVLAMALVLYLVSDFVERDMIFAFNAAFACLAVGIASHLRASIWMMSAVAALAFAAIAVRTLWITYPGDPSFPAFHAAAATAMVLVAIVARTPAVAKRPWLALGGASMAGGLAALSAGLA